MYSIRLLKVFLGHINLAFCPRLQHGDRLDLAGRDDRRLGARWWHHASHWPSATNIQSLNRVDSLSNYIQRISQLLGVLLLAQSRIFEPRFVLFCSFGLRRLFWLRINLDFRFDRRIDRVRSQNDSPRVLRLLLGLRRIIRIASFRFDVRFFLWLRLREFLLVHLCRLFIRVFNGGNVLLEVHLYRLFNTLTGTSWLGAFLLHRDGFNFSCNLDRWFLGA